jgi:DNA-binding NarL/FixJ family response regulator
LQLLGEGLTYKETATQLGLSWRTVQTQAKYAYAKLGAHDRADAVAKARRRGEI